MKQHPLSKAPPNKTESTKPILATPTNDLSPTNSSPKTTGIITYIDGIPIRRNFIHNLPYNTALRQRAFDNRKAGILAEVLFWQQVHKRKFFAIDFDRQRVIGNYIVDFYVKTLGLVVEIDGSSHLTKVEYDEEREQYLQRLGLLVYRIDDRDIKRNPVGTMHQLKQFIIDHFTMTV